METITWHENMYEYFRDLAFRKINIGCRIDPHFVNDELLNSEYEYTKKHGEYLSALNARHNLT